MKILITGVAGFIGGELALKLLARGDQIVGIDNFNDYYEVSLKQARLQRFIDVSNFEFVRLDIADRAGMKKLFSEHSFDAVINLAAQVGVRYSLEDPNAYIDTNLVGFGNILEGCRHTNVKHLLFASSSSVYGGNTKLPFAEQDNVSHPVSLYAATKKAAELMAHSYAHLYNLHCTGLRFFTVYGPWGRPDMAYFSFTRKILAGEPIPVFNEGKMKRDFTYIDDIIEGTVKILDKMPSADNHWNWSKPNPAASYAPYRIFNIGNSKAEDLMHFIKVLENCLGRKAKIDMLPMQNGDVRETFADTAALERAVEFKPSTSIETGLHNFVDWYMGYHSI